MQLGDEKKKAEWWTTRRGADCRVSLSFQFELLLLILPSLLCVLADPNCAEPAHALVTHWSSCNRGGWSRETSSWCLACAASSPIFQKRQKGLRSGIKMVADGAPLTHLGHCPMNSSAHAKHQANSELHRMVTAKKKKKKKPQQKMRQTPLPHSLSRPVTRKS